MWTIYKEQPDSPHKIDGAMAAILSWDGRCMAIAAGAGQRRGSVYEERGLLTV
jgi:stage V sporulation protein SpoVS